MQCPNCGDQDYQQGNSCAACGFVPAGDPDLLRKGREEREAREKQLFRENLTAAVGAVLFFVFIFWVFPSGRRATDWFDLTMWEVVWAMILATIGFSAMYKKD